MRLRRGLGYGSDFHQARNAGYLAAFGAVKIRHALDLETRAYFQAKSKYPNFEKMEPISNPNLLN